MSGATRDRRGDRRGGAWECPECMVGPKFRREDPDTGRVSCDACGHVDRRSTAGNRRRARAELEALCQRIAAELHGLAGAPPGPGAPRRTLLEVALLLEEDARDRPGDSLGDYRTHVFHVAQRLRELYRRENGPAIAATSEPTIGFGPPGTFGGAGGGTSARGAT